MTLCNKDSFKPTSQFIEEIPGKEYNKIDPMVKLHVIRALENGQTKIDIAREFGINPKTVTNIYKQKESIIKKYTKKQNHSKEVPLDQIHLEQILLEWLRSQAKNENFIDIEKLKEKARQLMNIKNEKSNYIDKWLHEFCVKHNIICHNLGTDCDWEAKEEWNALCKNYNFQDVYVGCVSALLYSLDLKDYVNQVEPENYVSILLLFNITGFDKKQLIVIGKNSLGSSIMSVPINYWCSRNPCVNTEILTSCLNKWNDDLKVKGENCLLLLNIPDEVLKTFVFSNIKIINALSIDFVKKPMENVVEAFKYHYRRLQISRKVLYDTKQLKFVDYIDMMCAAWYNVPCAYIHHLFVPTEKGYIYLNNSDVSGNHSLSEWCKKHKLPLDADLYSEKLDSYILCDKKLSCVDYGIVEDNRQNDVDYVQDYDFFLSNSAIEAYQAMKRLISYLQGESPRAKIIESAKCLENNFEYGALSELTHIFSNNSENNDSD